jgi:hypothetical protein
MNEQTINYNSERKINWLKILHSTPTKYILFIIGILLGLYELFSLFGVAGKVSVTHWIILILCPMLVLPAIISSLFGKREASVILLGCTLISFVFYLLIPFIDDIKFTKLSLFPLLHWHLPAIILGLILFFTSTPIYSDKYSKTFLKFIGKFIFIYIGFYVFIKYILPTIF